MIARPAQTRAAARFSEDGAGSLSQERLLVMLYERLQRDLHTAADAIRAKDRETAHRTLLHAQEIVSELDGALNHEVWDGAGRLSDVYRYLMDRLIVANVTQDAPAVEECLRVVDPLVATWNEAWTSLSSAPKLAPPPAAAAAAADHLGGVRSAPSLDVVG